VLAVPVGAGAAACVVAGRLAHPLPIAADDSAASLHDKLAALGADAIVGTLAQLDGCTPQPQPEEGVTYAAKLSKDEAPEQMKAFFDLADADKDGFITTSELTTSMKAMGGGGDRGGERGGPPRDGDTSVQPANKAAGAAQ